MDYAGRQLAGRSERPQSATEAEDGVSSPGKGQRYDRYDPLSRQKTNHAIPAELPRGNRWRVHPLPFMFHAGAKARLERCSLNAPRAYARSGETRGGQRAVAHTASGQEYSTGTPIRQPDRSPDRRNKSLFMQPKSPDDDSGVRIPVRKLRIDPEDAGQRIDNFLTRTLPGVPKGRIYRMLRKGEVRVNGGRIRAEYKLVAGDELRIPPVTVRPAGESPAPGLVSRLENRIIFEDKALIVVNKPSGLAVHGGSGVSHGVIEVIRAARPACKGIALAHRIDRETSGCLVLTKKRSALRRVHELFREGRVEKNYLALVKGDWQYGERLIDQPLLVTNREGGERHVTGSGRGKPAETRVRLSRRYRTSCLVQCQPRTGRTHQIRVHLAEAGHPILGDARYGDSEANKRAASAGLKRLFLHAQSISFPDESGNERHFAAPLPEELERYLAMLSE